METAKFRNNRNYLIDSSDDLLFYNASNTNYGQSVSNISTTCRNSFHEDDVTLRTISTNSGIDDSLINMQSVKTVNLDKQKKIGDLKESTRKLLDILDRISLDTHSDLKVHEITPRYIFKPIQPHEDGGECLIYNRLTRKCQCLNSSSYNDFILQFNENIKHSTCDLGEIIKNMKIVKKFLYMGDGYTQNALLFLREGLTQSTICEKTDIIEGCIHADICNIFEEHSIVTSLIIWPCKYATYGDCMTQMLTGILLHKIASTEGGKRYLNLNSKIIHDIKIALKKHHPFLNRETIENLNGTLYLLDQHFVRHKSVPFYGKINNKDLEIQTLSNLIKHRSQMTISEVSLHLEMINNFSKHKRGKIELTKNISLLLLLLKNILKDYDSSEINVIAANILNNVISKGLISEKVLKEKNTMSTLTEAIQMENKIIQIYGMKENKKQKHIHKNKKSNLPIVQDVFWESTILGKSKKVCDKTRKHAIIVPVE